jgi:Type II CAAX prenyl endopeptidase Rce1-like
MSGTRAAGPTRPRRSRKAPRRMAVAHGGRGAAGSPFGRGDLAVSLLLVFPLFLAYEVGVMFSPTVNGVDFVTRWVFAAVGYDRERFLLVHLVLAIGFLAVLLYLRRQRSFRLRAFPPMLLESVAYALTMGTAIAVLMERVLGVGLFVPDALDPAELASGERTRAVVMSLGAGVHEELVFRLGLMGGGAAALMLIGLGRALSVTAALAVSAVLFSAAHHAGPMGEAFDTGVFVYRLLAGVVFGLVFYFRSLAHAVYTHFLYDLYVLLLRG